jgi:multiple sugar transport system ATP-binding protein
MLQIDMLLDRRPKDLSGGQRQRVAIGRAVVREPRIFLFDEPLSNLDAELRVDMRGEISALHKRLGNTMIYVTHDQVEAMTMADKIAVLRLGELEQFGRPLDLYNAPENLFVAGFIGSPKMNFLKGTVGEDRTHLTLDTGDHVALPETRLRPTPRPEGHARPAPQRPASRTQTARSTPRSAPSSSSVRKATSTAISPTAHR